MNLDRLCRFIPGASLAGDSTREVSGLEYDSRRVSPGQVFFAISGTKRDGMEFVPEAVARGASAVVSELAPRAEAAAGMPAAWIQAPNARLALALASAGFYGSPSERLKLIGVTGTNGKTTVSYLLASILAAAGWKPALFGTIAYHLEFGQSKGSEGETGSIPAPNTTPESRDLQRMLREVAAQGGRAAVMEVSSHALALDRVAGCSFHAGVFTNFSRDHLDFHGDMENYMAAKKRLFAGYAADDSGAIALKPPAFAVLNADDERYGELRKIAPVPVISYGLAGKFDVTTKRFKATRHGIEFTADTPRGPIEIRSKLVGRHNVYNLLAAAAAAQTLEIDAAHVAAGVASVQVPGRMESVGAGQPFGVFVDYAHTDDALGSVLRSVREWSGDGRIVLVFGCGGDRDRAKRPLMGAAAAAADKAILTSDNPRGEDPLRILNDVIVGLQKARANYVTEPNRARAIELALEEARPGDIVIVAGKGHEKYQLIGGEKFPFDDREVARSVLLRMGFERA